MKSEEGKELFEGIYHLTSFRGGWVVAKCVSCTSSDAVNQTLLSKWLNSDLVKVKVSCQVDLVACFSRPCFVSLLVSWFSSSLFVYLNPIVGWLFPSRIMLREDVLSTRNPLCIYMIQFIFVGSARLLLDENLKLWLEIIICKLGKYWWNCKLHRTQKNVCNMLVSMGFFQLWVSLLITI